MDKNQDFFTRITARSTEWFGSPLALFLSVLVVIIWLIGVIFVRGHFGNDSYQLLINSVTTIITFNMVFLIQASANREMRAIHAKLDAIIKDTQQLPNEFVGIEALSEREINDLQKGLIDPSSDEESRGH